MEKNISAARNANIFVITIFMRFACCSRTRQRIHFYLPFGSFLFFHFSSYRSVRFFLRFVGEKKDETSNQFNKNKQKNPNVSSWCWSRSECKGSQQTLFAPTINKVYSALVEKKRQNNQTRILYTNDFLHCSSGRRVFVCVYSYWIQLERNKFSECE